MKSTFVETISKVGIRTIVPIAVITVGFGILAAGGFFFWKNAQQPAPVSKTPTMQSLTTQLLDLNTKYKSAPVSIKAQKLTALRSVAEKRKRLAAALLKSDPAAFLKTSLKESDRKSLPLEIQSLVEQPVTLQGELQVEVADDFEHAVAHYSYTVKTKDRPEPLTLHFAGPGPSLLSDATVNVSGIQLETDIAVPDTTDTETVPATTIPNAPLGLQVISQPATAAVTGTKRVAMLLFLSNVHNPSNYPTVSEIQGFVQSIRDYYTLASLNNLNLVFDVYGYFTTTYDTTTCSWGPLDHDVDLTGYDYKAWDLPYPYLAGDPNPLRCHGGPAGEAIIGGDTSSIYNLQGGKEVHIIGHELGHNFGAHHASTINCTDTGGSRQPIGVSCTLNEYGDPFDIMNSQNTPHLPHLMNNYHRGQLGWFQLGHTRDITTNGTCTAATPCTIIPLQSSNPGTSIGNYYYLEYRQPSTPFDNFSPSDPVVNGVSIRLAPDYPRIDFSKLIDTTVASEAFPDFTNAPLAAGQTLTDSQYGVSVSTERVLSSGADVSIVLTCSHQNPRIQYLTNQWVDPQMNFYRFTITNNDTVGCQPSLFTVAPALPVGWSSDRNQLLVTLAPQSSLEVVFGIAPPAGVTSGVFVIPMTVSSVDPAGYTGTANQIYKISSADSPVFPIVTIASPSVGATYTQGDSINISASASADSSITFMWTFIDGIKQYTCSSSPCSWSLETSSLTSVGSHTIAVIAASSLNGEGTSTITTTILRGGGGGGGPTSKKQEITE